MVDLELSRLRKQIAEERRKLAKQQQIGKTQEEKRILKKELAFLKSPSRRITSKLGRRLGRGLKITGKKVGKALLKQVRLIQEQQERERRVQLKLKKLQIKTSRKQPKLILVQRKKSSKKKGKKRKSRKQRRSVPMQGDNSIFGGIDF